MNFEGAKENIQPLAAGRNVEQLEVALNAESHLECHEELLQQRRQFESDIMNYVGDDPIDLWFEYVTWVEQSFPKSGKESALDDLLKKCLSTFEKDNRYAQDPRFIRLFIKYIDTKKNPHLYYTKLYNSGIGTMVADLYIAWAHYFDILDDFEQAKSVYQKGLDARAAPIEQLKQIYERFQFSVGQRIIRKEEYRQEFLTAMEAQRNAFTSLRSLKRSKVGSIRTGSAVKSVTPGQVRQSHPRSTLSTSNAPLHVYEGASQTTAKIQPQSQSYRSVVEEIENSMVENNIEPGPWSKASSRKSVFDNVHGNSTLKFVILEDDNEQPLIKVGPLPPDNGNLAIDLPKNFVRKNEPQTPFIVPAYVEDTIEVNAIPCYHKYFLHPNATVTFSSEELRKYRWLKEQNISNDYTKEKESYWGIGNQVATRILANFPRQNQPQTDMKTERPDISSIPSTEHFLCKLEEIYPQDSSTEMSFEELNREKWIKNGNNDDDEVNGGMEETICVRGRQSFGVAHTRKSITAGGRKSIMPLANDKGVRSLNLISINEDSSSDMEIDGGNENSKWKEKVSAVVNVEKRVEKSHKAEAAVPAEKKVELPPKMQWSIFTDDEPSPPVPPAPAEPKSNTEEESLTVFSSKDTARTVDSSVKAKDVFAVPLVPVSRLGSLVEKRTLESAPVKICDTETPSKIALPDRSPYPIGPQTGAVKKSIRKSLVAENAIPVPVNVLPVNPAGSESRTCNNENAFKSPLVDLDYSLCTQAFNFNLAEKMVSTPVSARRAEPLFEQIRAQETQPPLKLSTIMETTEGSTHTTTSTKSSTQFSSPEDDDLSKRSNVTNRTKGAGATVFSENDLSSGVCRNDYKSQHVEELPSINSYANVEKTLPAIQMSLLTTEATSASVIQNQNEVTASAAPTPPPPPPKDVPVKNYPFPIFEDTQTIANMSPEPQNSPTPTMPLAVAITTVHPKRPSTHDLQNSNHTKDGQFNMTSFWIKDEPQSYTSNDSASEESFAIPSVPHQSEMLPEPSRMLDGVAEMVSLQQQHDDCGSVEDDSFALPNVYQNKKSAERRRTVFHDTHTKDQPQVDVSLAEESFALPNVCQTKPSVSQRRRTIVGEIQNNFAIDDSYEAKDQPQVDDSMAEESFALPNASKCEAVPEPINANRTFEQDDSSDMEEEEEEIILVPDETLIEDVPKIVQVQSLANQNGENRVDMSIRLSISLTEDEMVAYMNQKVQLKAQLKNAPNNDGDHEETLTATANCDQSIYFKHNSILAEPSWIENEAKPESLPEMLNVYQHEQVNLEESRIVIETKLAGKAVDPFNEALKMAILHELQFVQQLETDGSAELVCAVPSVTVKRTIPFKGTHFDVLKCIGHGAYGRVYTVTYAKNSSTYAVKKEKPANLWECYILKEVHRRITGDVLAGFMRINMAIIGNDGSLLFSEYSPYGTLLDVCNRVFTSIKSNVNETIVLILAYQTLQLIDSLHKADILHLDLKPDNFLVMKPMSSNHQDLFIQLIDFGNAVDLRQFPDKQQFNAALETKHFVCIEMLEQRPWIYQPDLFCLAATIHSVLFGRYMEVRKIGQNYVANVKVPRYFNGVWNRFFNELINVPANTSPDLQHMSQQFHETIVGDQNLERKILEFNRFIH